MHIYELNSAPGGALATSHARATHGSQPYMVSRVSSKLLATYGGVRSWGIIMKVLLKSRMIEPVTQEEMSFGDEEEETLQPQQNESGRPEFGYDDVLLLRWSLQKKIFLCTNDQNRKDCCPT